MAPPGTLPRMLIRSENRSSSVICCSVAAARIRVVGASPGQVRRRVTIRTGGLTRRLGRCGTARAGERDRHE
jgi:hypothetical protein